MYPWIFVRLGLLLQGKFLDTLDTKTHMRRHAKRIWVWPRAIVHSLVISPLGWKQKFRFQGLFHNGKTPLGQLYGAAKNGWTVTKIKFHFFPLFRALTKLKIKLPTHWEFLARLFLLEVCYKFGHHHSNFFFSFSLLRALLILDSGMWPSVHLKQHRWGSKYR